MPADDENVVSYSVKELLADIKTSIERIYGKLDAKADRADVAQLSRRLEHESNRIDDLEKTVTHQEKAASEKANWRVWAWPTAASVALVAVTLLSIFLK